MTQKIKYDKPPMFDELLEAGFDVNAPDVIFTYGEILYNPHNVHLDSALLAHEALHTKQQMETPGGAAAWWRKWIHDPAFRAEQEAQAYGVQYRHACKIYKNREDRSKYLNAVVHAFAGGLYKINLSSADARQAIVKRAG